MTRIDVRKTYKLAIGGAFPRSESGRTYEVTDAKGAFWANASAASRKDARDAVVAARAAFKGWSTRTPYNRGQVVYRVAEVLEGRRLERVQLLGVLLLVVVVIALPLYWVFEPSRQAGATEGLEKRLAGWGSGLFAPTADGGFNCAGCHGTAATGGPGFPSLADDDWLWGGDPDTMMETLRVGVNAGHPDTRVSQMLAFGRDGILGREEIRTVVDYVRSLSGAAIPAERAAAGAEIYAANCASCHGEDGRGSTELGAPNLTDDIWIYGGDAASLFTTVHDGRQGWMPTWEGRLTETERKILTVYLQDIQRKATQ